MSQHGCPERLSDRSKGFQEDGPSQPTMEVLVETLTGTAFEMTVSPSDTIFAIKSKICRVEGIPVSQQHLVYKLRELEDARSLRSLGIGEGARLRLVLGMRGGPISTRRLPPAPAAGLAEPWRDIERLLDSSREDEWSGGSSGGSGASGGGGGGGGGCKVTVLVYRDGERVNMLRVRENRDGTYSPIDHNKYSSSLTHLSEAEGEEVGAGGGAAQNAVTMGKMLELRRRMESLSVRRRVPRARQPRPPHHAGEKAEMQKTRSEETLSVPSLLDDACVETFKRIYTPYSEAEDTFAPLYDGNYTRYDYDCSFADRYTLLPPIGRTDSEQSVSEAAADGERLQLSELAGSILVQGRREEGAAIFEECLDGVEECHIRQDSPQLAAEGLAPIPAAECGPLVGGESLGWRVVGFGSSSQLSAAAPAGAGGGGAGGGARPAHARSASSLHAHAPHAAAPPPPKHYPPLLDALFSSSTSDLEKLKRNRILPALSRHRNREHLHLSDEGLDAPPAAPAAAERRQRRIHKIAELDTSRVYRFGDFEEVKKVEPDPRSPEKKPDDPKAKRLRIRCGFCKKRLSIATVHRCRCGAEFCAPHRYAEVHGCAYDYKADAHRYLQRANPLVSAPKLPKI